LELPSLLAHRGERVRGVRLCWRHHRQPAMRLEPHRVYFLDETSVNTKMVRAYGWGIKSKRLVVDAPYGHWLTQTFIAALRCDGLAVQSANR